MSTYTKTKFPGVRYREHRERKHGKQPDKYFFIRYQRDGKRVEEGLGWSSEGWSAAKANEELSVLKKAARLGEGPQRLQEKRQLEEDRRQEETLQAEEDAKKATTFGEFFTEQYFPAQDHKKKATLSTEKGHFKNWLEPNLGTLPLNRISPFHLQKLQKAMKTAGKSPRTVQYVFATFRQVWSLARRRGYVSTDPPSRSEDVKLQRVNNKRERYLTREEAETLLQALKAKSERTHDMALLALHTGMRAGEVARLTVDAVNFHDGTIVLRETKSGRSRFVPMTLQIREMLKRRIEALEKLPKERETDLLFSARQGKASPEASHLFSRIADELFNMGVTDPKQRVTFHTLRHSFASWLVIAGTPLFTVQRLLGHSSISMTERYSHLAPENSRAAAAIIENGNL